jgi:hypothetical protein
MIARQPQIDHIARDAPCQAAVMVVTAPPDSRYVVRVAALNEDKHEFSPHEREHKYWDQYNGRYIQGNAKGGVETDGKIYTQREGEHQSRLIRGYGPLANLDERIHYTILIISGWFISYIKSY